jgi:hypothetical protein
LGAYRQVKVARAGKAVGAGQFQAGGAQLVEHGPDAVVQR